MEMMALVMAKDEWVARRRWMVEGVGVMKVVKALMK